MLISFFGDNPSKKDLDKLKLINFTTRVYLVTRGYKEFNNITLRLNKENIKDSIYWPTSVLRKDYWISPFCNRSALLKIFNKNINSHIMVNVELKKEKLLYLSRMFKLFKDKKSIKEFIEDNRNYPASDRIGGELKNDIINALGLGFDPEDYDKKIIKFLSRNITNKDRGFIKKEFPYEIKTYGTKYMLALKEIRNKKDKKEGLRLLNKDLKIAKKLKVLEIIIYNIGLLNEDYIKAIKKYK